MRSMLGSTGTAIDRRDHWVDGLDALRFIFAMVVFLSHLENVPASYLKSFDSSLVRLIGVAFNHSFLGPGAVVGFFIISGFVIHYPVKTKRLHVRSFLVRRWLRIGVPLLVVATLSGAVNKFWLIPIWSLYCELIYYTIYPLLRRSGIRWELQILIALLVATVVIIFFGQAEIKSMLAQDDLGYTGSYASLGDGLTWLVGLPCWLMGVWMAEHIDAKKADVSFIEMNTIRVIMFILAAVTLGLKAHWYVSFLLTLNILAFPLCYWIEKEILFFRNHRPWAWLEQCGSFSYSLYLLHGVCAFYLVDFFGLTLLTYPLIIVVTLGVAYLFYVLIERPSHVIARKAGRIAGPRLNPADVTIKGQ